MMTDPLADMLTRIRNSIKGNHDRVEFPASRLKAGVCKVLKSEGYIRSFKIIIKSKSNVNIKVLFKKDALVGLKKFSKPSLRQYSGYRDIPRVLSGLGTSIISTSRGVMSTREAKHKKLGGEILCQVW